MSAIEVAVAAPADLAVRGLSKRFGAKVQVLSDVSLAVGKAEAVALIGANGAGKSTLLRSCLRLIEPDAGEIRLLGEEVRSLKPAALRRLRARIGFVFQRHNLVPRLPVLSNVLHGAAARCPGPRAWFHEIAPRALREEAMSCLQRVGLADLATRRADQLSGGQSQRVAIARALMQRPQLMLADEPVASLDPAAGEEVMGCFLDLIRHDRLTLVFTTHDLRHALDYGDRVVGLRGGRVTIDAPAAALDVPSLRSFYE
ncbi:MAG TPA: phosphonate ABC transporter ATP-binding protein [Burkholderiales bacterium]|nr:phosphonate ABC transporter ATP-binding protein [Burkholderiales bacterium]